MNILFRFEIDKFQVEIQEEIEGTILNNLEEVKERLNKVVSFLNLKATNFDATLPVSIGIDQKDTPRQEQIPLDLFLQKYNADEAKPQKRVLAVCLYLSETFNMFEIMAKDINEILSKNKLPTIGSIATHARRLRDKGLISLKSSNGKENLILMYNNKFAEIKSFLKIEE